MKLLSAVSSALIVSALGLSSVAQSHPGRTASDGCHYCRTNCSSWGETAGARHCHGSVQPSEEIITDEVAYHHHEPPYDHTHSEDGHHHADKPLKELLENPVSGL